MHPEKEGKHLLARLVEVWGYYTDGWLFSVTWDRGSARRGAWRLCAEHPAGGGAHGYRVRVTACVDALDWLDRHYDAVDAAAEQMYLDSFLPENRVEVA